MSKSNTKVLTPGDVRALFREDGPLDATKVTVTRTVKGEQVTEVANDACLTGGPQGRGRGRVAKPFIEAALAHKGKGWTYAEKVTREPQVTLTVTGEDKRGRKTSRKVNVPLSEARARSGQSKGRLSAASIAKASESLSAERAAAKSQA